MKKYRISKKNWVSFIMQESLFFIINLNYTQIHCYIGESYTSITKISSIQLNNDFINQIQNSKIQIITQFKILSLLFNRGLDMNHENTYDDESFYEDQIQQQIISNVQYQKEQLKNYLDVRFTQLLIEYINVLINYPRKLQNFQDFLPFDNKIEITSNQKTKNKLYFYPKKILLNQNELKVNQLKSIVRIEHKGGLFEGYIQNNRSRHEQCILFYPDLGKPHQCFHIKNKINKLADHADSDILIENLYIFYTKICQGLDYITNFIFYWAYCRGILNPRYLSENSLKMLIIVFLTVQGIPNAIAIYRFLYKDYIKQIQNCLEIGKYGKWQINPIIKNYIDKYVIEYKKGFFLKSESRYQMMPIIYPIQYPIIPKQVQQMALKLNPSSSSRFKKHKIGYWIHLFFKKINKILQQGNSLKVDLMPSESSNFCFSQNKSEESQTLIVLHPVYKHNLCENLKNRQLFNVVKAEISRANEFLSAGNDQSLIKLCCKYKL